MIDKNSTLSHFKKTVDVFLRDRDWHQFHNPKVDSIGLVVEAGELLELFIFSLPNDGGKRVFIEKREAAEDEVVDVFYWTICFANTVTIDLAHIVSTKLRSSLPMVDDATTLSDLITLVMQSKKPYLSLTDEATNISSKASALMTLFLEQSHDGTGYDVIELKRGEIESLLADTLIAIVRFAESASIDIPTAFARKTEKNAKKYPVEKSKGKSTKYTDL